ncbi:NAD-dependent epimerase/dehydratase family protein [Micromonospora sp. KC207]|uniref:NAD-dependent epimerase/dehydratase family protein n=1 Tax=Micromonospora sp. KC207 TaxID=2530377 RepID=UPI001A9EC137|nr:NAD-dependent epimerase/dehydratase family protein [Micromonospora sp. KC207]
MSRAPVTGAAGFIGLHLIDALLGSGTAVVGLDRRRLNEQASTDEMAGTAASSRNSMSASWWSA